MSSRVRAALEIVITMTEVGPALERLRAKGIRYGMTKAPSFLITYASHPIPCHPSRQADIINSKSNNMPNLQPHQPQSSHQSTTSPLKQQPMLRHPQRPPPTRQIQISVQHLMQDRSPNLLFGLSLEHGLVQADEDHRDSGPREIVRHGDAAGLACHESPFDFEVGGEEVGEEEGVEIGDYWGEGFEGECVFGEGEEGLEVA